MLPGWQIEAGLEAAEDVDLCERPLALDDSRDLVDDVVAHEELLGSRCDVAREQYDLVV